MKLTIKLPTGIEIEYEGDETDFDRFTAFLEQLPSYVEDLGKAPAEQADEKENGDSDGDEGEGNPAVTLTAERVKTRLDNVRAADHIKRLTVMAWSAVEAGQEGLDFQTADRLYSEIGIAKPGSWKSAFGNARTKGFLRSARRGRWVPTLHGENFARYGSGGKASTNGTEGGEDDL